MAADLKSQEKQTTDQTPKTQEEPGLCDTIGSFPVWMLKIIDALTPDFLRTPSPGKKPPKS